MHRPVTCIIIAQTCINLIYALFKNIIVIAKTTMGVALEDIHGDFEIN